MNGPGTRDGDWLLADPSGPEGETRMNVAAVEAAQMAPQPASAPVPPPSAAKGEPASKRSKSSSEDAGEAASALPPSAGMTMAPLGAGYKRRNDDETRQGRDKRTRDQAVPTLANESNDVPSSEIRVLLGPCANLRSHFNSAPGSPSATALAETTISDFEEQGPLSGCLALDERTTMARLRKAIGEEVAKKWQILFKHNRRDDVTSVNDINSIVEATNKRMNQIMSDIKKKVDSDFQHPEPKKGNEAPLSLGLFGEQGHGKSYIFNSILGVKVSRDASQDEGVTVFPVRATHNESMNLHDTQVMISLVNGQHLEQCFPCVDEAEEYLKQHPRDDVLCIDVTLNSPALADLGFVLIDLPGLNKEAKDDISKLLRPFISGKYRIDAVAHVVRGRMSVGFDDLKELGFFTGKADSIPMYIRLVNPGKGENFTSFITIFNGAKRTYAQLAEDGHFDSHVNNKRLEIIKAFQDHGPAMKEATADSVCRRIAFVPFDSAPDHGEASSAREAFSALREETRKCLEQLCLDLKLFRALRATSKYLADLHQSVRTAKQAANADLVTLRSQLNNLVEDFKKSQKESLSQFDYSEASLDLLQDNDGFQELCEGFHSFLAREEDDREKRNECRQRYMAILNCFATQVLDDYQRELRRTQAHNINKWEKLFQKRLKGKTRGKGNERAKAGVLRLLQKDAEDRYFLLQSNHQGIDLPEDPATQQLFTKHLNDNVAARKDMEVAIDSFVDKDYQPQQSFETYEDFEREFRLPSKFKEDIVDLANDSFQAWSSYEPQGPLVRYSKNTVVGRRPSDAKATENVGGVRETLAALEKATVWLLKALHPLEYGEGLNGGSKRKVTLDEELPPVVRLSAQRNDKVLQRDFVDKEPDDGWANDKGKVMDSIPRDERIDSHVLTRITVDAETKGILYTGLDDQQVDNLQSLSRPVQPSSTMPDQGEGKKLHPIFVLSKLRRKDVDDKELIIPPSLYVDKLNQDQSVSYQVIAVVDREEEAKYIQEFCKHENLNGLTLISIETPKNLPINVGRKRQLIKLLAERILKLKCYWTLDDDLKDFIEVDTRGFQRPCTMARALYFAQLVLANEVQSSCLSTANLDLFHNLLHTTIHGVTLEEETKTALHSSIVTRKLPSTDILRKLEQHLDESPSKETPANVCKNRKTALQALPKVRDGDVEDFKKLVGECALRDTALTMEDKMKLLPLYGDETLCRQSWVTGEHDDLLQQGGYGDKVKSLRQRNQMRVALFGLIAQNHLALADPRKWMVDSNLPSHVNRAQLYQCTLFHTPGSLFVDYLSREEFFRTVDEKALQKFHRQCQGKTDQKQRNQLARSGFKHEDWYMARKLLPEANRARYQIIRFAFSERNVPSLVNKVSQEFTSIAGTQVDRSDSDIFIKEQGEWRACQEE